MYQFIVTILNTISEELPFNTEEGEIGDSVDRYEFTKQIAKKVIATENFDESEEYVEGYVTAIITALRFLGVTGPYVWDTEKVYTTSFDGYAVVRSWLEYLQNGISYFDFSKENDPDGKKIREFVEDLELKRIAKTRKQLLSPIRYVNISIGIIRGYCDDLEKVVYLFHKGSFESSSNSRDKMWMLVGGKLMLDDIHDIGFRSTWYQKLKDNKFFAESYWIERCLKRKISEQLGLSEEHYNVKYAQNDETPIVVKELSKSCGQFTEYHYYPFIISLNEERFSLLGSIQKRVKWFTPEAIKAGFDEDTKIGIDHSYILSQLNIFDYSSRNAEIPLSLSKNIPLSDVYDILEDVKIDKEFRLNIKKKVLYHVSDEKRFCYLDNDIWISILITLAREQGRTVSIEKVQDRIPGIYDIDRIYSFKSELQNHIRKHIGKDIIGTIRLKGYYISDY